MRIFDRLFGALLALLIAIAPVAADTTTVPVSGWTEIGTGTIIVNALDREGVLLKDGATKPTGTSGDLRVPWGGFSPPIATTTKWWALPGDSAASTRVGVVTVPSASGAVAPSNLAVGAAAKATGQISVGATPTLIVAARTGAVGTGRVHVTFKNKGAVTVYLGASDVATTTGHALDPGDAFTIDDTVAIYGISATAGQTVTFWETY